MMNYWKVMVLFLVVTSITMITSRAEHISKGSIPQDEDNTSDNRPQDDDIAELENLDGDIASKLTIIIYSLHKINTGGSSEPPFSGAELSKHRSA